MKAVIEKSMKIVIRIPTLMILVALLAGCAGAAETDSSAASVLARAQMTQTAAPTESAAPVSANITGGTPTAIPQTPLAEQQTTPLSRATTVRVTPTLGITPTPRPTLKPDEWKDLPVIPEVSDKVLSIYQRGLELGNNPQAFSKIGDCGSTPAWFLGDFDRGPRYYRLGEYQALQRVIDEFHGSFDRTSLAARSGFNASALFTPLWSDRAYCNAGEAPLECEYRVHRPILAFITLGANDVWHPKEFEPQMRKTIEYSIEYGVIPVLATKADNQEGDGSINAVIARLAREYDLPLWNYWAAVNALPNQGLQEDGTHLTWGPNSFDDPEAMSKAWPLRNLTALQVLDAVWGKISAVSPAN